VQSLEDYGISCCLLAKTPKCVDVNASAFLSKYNAGFAVQADVNDTWCRTHRDGDPRNEKIKYFRGEENTLQKSSPFTNVHESGGHCEPISYMYKYEHLTPILSL